MLFLQRHIFHDVMITFFCGTFALRMEITLKLRFVFVRQCDLLQLRTKTKRNFYYLLQYYVTIALFIFSMYLRFLRR